MKIYEPRMHVGACMIFFLLWLLLEGCSVKSGGFPEGLLGTPEFHTFNGFRFIKKERVGDAQREFEVALRLKHGYSPALRGMGLVRGMKGDFVSAFESMEQAKKSSEQTEKALAYVGIMQLETMRRDQGWLARVKDNFASAISMAKDLPEAHYHMGMAYQHAYLFADSAAAFREVLKIARSLQEEAEEQLARLRKIERAMPLTGMGTRLAILDRITRADVAALLIHEVEVEKICKGDERVGRYAVPPDVVGHPLRVEIERVLPLDIEGLRTFADGNFGPDETVTRAAFAVTLADLIAKKEGDPLLVGRYSGVASPFKDIRRDATYFNAVMTCTMRGPIMEGENGFFDPTGPLSGADALLILKRLKTELNIISQGKFLKH